MRSFTLDITLGNAAMMSYEDVAAALEDVAARLREYAMNCGMIRDANGNSVGTFDFTDDES